MAERAEPNGIGAGLWEHVFDAGVGDLSRIRSGRPGRKRALVESTQQGEVPAIAALIVFIAVTLSRRANLRRMMKGDENVTFWKKGKDEGRKRLTFKRRNNEALINVRLDRFRSASGGDRKLLGDAKRLEHREPHREEQVLPQYFR